MSAERRTNPRFVCDLEAEIELAEGEDRIRGRTSDLSYSGICVEAERAVPTGATALFHLRLVLPQGESDALALRGTVVWSTGTTGGAQIGARFQSDMSDEQLRKLDIVLRALSGELDLRRA